jgi:hypothetical protein
MGSNVIPINIGMKVRFIWNLIPILIFITNFMPKRFGGYTVGPFILIRPEYKNDEGLIQHELVHVKQFIRSFGIVPLLSTFNKQRRLNSECECYAKQLQYVDKKNYSVVRARFVNFMYTKYQLGMSKNYIRRRLQKYEDLV